MNVKVSTVFGSPGSGKTAALEAEFLAAVASGLLPSQVLALAATRDAANSLRDSLALKLQAATSTSLARTLSSFAFGVMRHRAVVAGQSQPELISGSEQDQILSELIASHLESDSLEAWPKHVNAAVISLAGFRAELRDLLTVCLEHGLSPESLGTLSFEQNKPVWAAASKLYQQYLTVVSGPLYQERHDPSQLLREAARWLQNNIWPEDIASIKLILLDDAQEITPAAAHLIEVLATGGASVCFFGDPDSSVLAFRSADPRAMSQLANRVAIAGGTSVEVTFLQPGQQPAQISAVLGRVAAQIETALAGRQRKGLLKPVALGAGKEPVEQSGVEGHVFVQPQAELAWLARRLRELHLYNCVPWSQMAVVARSQDALAQLAASLSSEGVPVRLQTQSPLRDEFGSRALLRFAWLVLEAPEITIELALETLTSPVCGLDSLGLRRVRRSLRRQELMQEGSRNSNELLQALFVEPALLAELRGPEIKATARFIAAYFAAKELMQDPAKSIEDLLWLIWSESGLEKSWRTLSRGIGEVAVQANRNLDSVVALFAAANRYVERHPGASATIFVNQQLALGLPEDTLALNNQQSEKVNLLTPSALISKKFQVVALPQLLEGVWPNLRPRSSLLGATALDSVLSGRTEVADNATQSELPGELRMLYKAVGSSYQHLLISATDTEDNQVSQFVRLMLGKQPEPTYYSKSQLSLRGLVGSLRRQLALPAASPVAALEKQAAAVGLSRLANAGIAGANPESWYGLAPISTQEPLIDLSNPESQVYVRPSQLEAFVKCPLHWFLGANGGSDSTFSASLGSLIHEALEHATEVNEAELWSLVDSKWHTLQFEADWLEQAGARKAKKMIANLVEYLQKFEASGSKLLGAEVDFEFELGRAKVRGQVDRLELDSSGAVMIVDLKTGAKPFTTAEVQHHAQLGLYQLAFDQGAFASLPGLPPEATLAGAKLLLVNGTKPTQRLQDSLENNAELKLEFQELLARAAQSMAMPDNLFVAEVGSHCTNENEYGTCKIHLTRAVSYVG